MTDRVYCEFKHIPSEQAAHQLAANVKKFVNPKTFDEDGIRNCLSRGEDHIKFYLTIDEANKLRDRLALVLPNESSPIWFHIEADPLNALDQRALHSTVDYRHEGSTFSLSCQLGSLRSHSLFYSHVSFNNKVLRWNFRPSRNAPDALVMEFDDIRISIPLNAIQKNNILINKQNEKSGILLLLPLKYTPYMYRLEPVKSGKKDTEKPDMKQVRLCADSRRNDLLRDIEHCSDLVIHFPYSQNLAWAFIEHFLVDRSYRYQINFGNFQTVDWSKEPNKSQNPDPFDYKQASYEDRYALQILISMGYVFRDKWAQLTDQELKWHTCDPKERYSLCCFVAEQLCANHGYDLTRALRDYNAKKKEKKKAESAIDEQEAVLAQNGQSLKVAACTLTPMRTIFQPMDQTVGSRALRHPDLGGPERFLLVHFREEHNDRLKVTNRNIKGRLRRSMTDGITLMGKNYRYMGASTGQMKEKAFWFIDLPSNIKSIEEAHGRLGKFHEIKNIATYIARVGQYFSRTLPVGITLTNVQNENAIVGKKGINYVTEIPDITRGPYNFTDGVGKISWGLAGRIAQKMKLPLSERKDIPSAFQIRVAGCKGMVAIDPESSLNDYYILVRKSMMKFESEDWNLEICDYARPITLTLNNQVIRLLSDLGNSDDTFRALQNESFHHWDIPEEQQSLGIEIAIRRKASYLSKDNLLTNRIPIPPTEGRNMFGVADETGELEYGQCFIQYSDFDLTKNGQRKYHVVKGTVIVTKNPCLWPGDVRRFEAVFNPKLEACMRDVIVFPIKGKRPHSNEMSGSDLDGDQYWVYWGGRFRIEKNTEPLSYKGADKMDIPSIDREKMIEHIIGSFEAGIMLGMIANTHTVAADKHEQHSFADPCKQLAELFALAVDSPKTGKFIEKEALRPFQKEYCRTWPRYMKKFCEPTSNSTSIQEKLFVKAADWYKNSTNKVAIEQIPIRRTPVGTNQITDAAFQKWLHGEPYEESSEPKKNPKPKVQKVNDEAGADDEQRASAKPKKSSTDNNPTRDKKPPARMSSADGPKRPETPDMNNPTTDPVVPKTTKKSTTGPSKKPAATNGREPLLADEHPPLVNTDFRGAAGSAQKPSASASLASSGYSTLSSLAPLNPGESYLDFQIISDPAITAAGNVEFMPVDGTWCIARPRNELAERPAGDKILDKFAACLKKQDILKRNSSALANQASYGSLYLMIFYGHIYFTKQDPQRLSALQELLKENGEQILQFNYANLDDLHKENSASNKTKIEYELDCLLNSSENITLLFDTKKILQQIRVYRVWSRSYIRLPNYCGDSLSEIRSVLTHESNSLGFNETRGKVFTGASDGLLGGRKPNITINRSLLRSSVVPISLKIIEEEQSTDTIEAEIDSFYRTVKYVSLNEGQDKPKKSLTLEYHVTPLNKNKDALEKICQLALSPLERARISGQPSMATTASSGLRGFSMTNQ